MKYQLKTTHKAVREYYETLQRYGNHDVEHELAVRSAFQNLLDFVARRQGLMLIPEQTETTSKGTIRPDGTICDPFNITLGFWEAKDLQDDIEKAIKQKKEKGYPLTNTIFENTHTGVLYQDGHRIREYNLHDKDQLIDLLNTFFGHEKPIYEDFKKAIEGFKSDVRPIAEGLNDIIKKAHKDHKQFQLAFDGLFTICQRALNPNIRRDAVDEMLIQHLLTERLIRNVFDNLDFIKRNVIANEIENVIDALTSRSFSRQEFLKKLDHFYIPIERATQLEPDFNKKLIILNNLYERFFQGYSVAVADTHGIVYTPEPVVDFMVNSVIEALKREFNKDLGDKKVVVIDPCTGTGSFVVKLIQKCERRHLEDFYQHRLFANEVMLMPYYIASLSIEHAYYERMNSYKPFEGICFVDTLDLEPLKDKDVETGITKRLGFSYMTAENTERVERERQSDITVIIGNPPYNAGQRNENDNNKNRKYPLVDQRIKITYSKDSKATNRNALRDAYVKFFRWASDRLGDRDGVVCFVSNNSFIDGIAFDGMRKHLSDDFERIYILDLKGNVRKGEENTVFGLSSMVGICVAMLVRKKGQKKQILLDELDWRAKRPEKFLHLKKLNHFYNADSEVLKTNDKRQWLFSAHQKQFDELLPICGKEIRQKPSQDAKVIFINYSRGVATCRDTIVYNFDQEKLIARVKKHISAYNSEVERYKRTNASDKTILDDFVNYKIVDWSESLKSNLKRMNYSAYTDEKLRMSMYRPFTGMFLFFDSILNERRYQFPKFFPTVASEKENRVICFSAIGNPRPFHCIMTDIIPDLHFTGDSQCFPFYAYNEDGGNRRENITDWALGQFREHYRDQTITKWDIFDYIYGVLHHPQYRESFQDCLRKELPRIPFAPDFRAFSQAGKELAHWHLDYEEIEPFKLRFEENDDAGMTWRVDKMKLSQDKRALIYNDWLTLNGIPEDAYKYRLGNRSALHWIIDQYQVKIDKRTGIVSDPNRDDEPRYIVDLIGKVIRVSLETLRIIEGLPHECW